ncbi:nucleotide-binding protein [Caldibacillus lycopersici]|uniref:Nucleotide-binding protein n=1 Tax=Perspicuibacillus lycopersici TaxID=1325689 RepID=A0AAE3IW61_9BACI|nr:nucleotide-binding protein [Perspicuibacillus lycopersici]MCU9614718.1 nucleotide-binding protein [Perspicuibacillus lycopersici]
MTQVKPRVFIGSSREAIKYVDAVHELLSFHAEVTPWSAGVFHVMDYPMENIEQHLNRSDFAVFIFSPDDLVLMRNKLYFATRDNTLFEMGLFWGRLGRGRVFCIIPSSVPKEFDGNPVDGYHIPTDLSGLTVLIYEQRTDGNLHAAVNVACSHIKHVIQKKHVFQDPAKELEKVQTKMDEDYALIRFLRKLTKELLADPTKQYEYLFEGLWNAFSTPDSYSIEGIGIYKAEQTDGLRQIAGNDGRNKFFPFNINDGRNEDEKIIVVDCFLKNEEQVLLRNQYIDNKYVFCYPIEKHLVITISITGRKKLLDADIDHIFLANHDLMKAIHYLFGGINHE